jgi:hypothetical protein
VIVKKQHFRYTLTVNSLHYFFLLTWNIVPKNGKGRRVPVEKPVTIKFEMRLLSYFYVYFTTAAMS